ncbi:MAG: hypothetical protein JWN96_3031 [Mycobacterium sp.]|nr:hypothetical protein [Mycobacterium sp.]
MHPSYARNKYCQTTMRGYGCCESLIAIVLPVQMVTFVRPG